MNHICLLFFIFQFSCLFGQEKWKDCTLQYELNTDEIQEKGIVKFSVTNTGNKKIRINQSFWAYRMQLTEIKEISPNEGRETGYFAYVDCFKDCIKKTIQLKPNYIYTYKINIRETIQYERLINESTYQFRLWFDLIDLTNEKCRVPYFTTDEIIYTKIQLKFPIKDKKIPPANEIEF